LVALAVAPSDPNYIYASTGSDLFVTINGGSSWNRYLPSGVNISSIAIHPSFPDRVWISSATTSNCILYSTNAGASFSNISGNLPAMAARSIVVDNTSEEGLYAGMNLGVYYKNKNMSSWVNLSGNLPLVGINEVELQPTTGTIRVGTYGRGVWQRPAYMPCGVPGSINVSDVKDTSALLNWTAAASSNGYNVDYRVLGASTWTNLINLTNATSFTLSGLQPSTSYEWRINSTCAEGSSDYLIDTFTTTTPCGKPTGLTTTAITTQTATLNWNVIDTALSYAVAYRSSGSNSWVTWNTATTQNTEIITGLSEGITYIWKVNATCDLGTGSADSAQFTTAITCLAPTSLSTTNITVSSATLNWALRTGATSYDVDMRTVGAASWTSKATNITSASLAISGLTGGVTYQWRVRSNCGTLSGYSNYDSTTFTSATPICTDTYENNNTTNQAKSIALNTEINALIGSASDSDYFKITSPNNTSTNIRVRLYNLPANYNLYLYDRNLVLLGSSTHTGTVADTIVYNSLAKKTTYYLKITGVSGSN
ncbi:MAG: fibronectin type III domain-containing protein, partial [Chitinophagaceae bacterium]